MSMKSNDLFTQIIHKTGRFWRKPSTRLMLLFGIEGILFQFLNSVMAYGNSLYATNMGATDTQIGLIQTIPNLIAMVLLLPIGILSDRAKSTKTLPILLLLIMALSCLGMGTVPGLGTSRILFFFLFLGIGVSAMANYNAQWQVFFGSVTTSETRNNVYTSRNRFMFFVGTLTPILCGAAMAAMNTSEEKLGALQIFYYLSGLFLFFQAFIIWKIPGGLKTEKELASTPKFQLSTLVESAKFLVQNKAFRSFFFSVLLFYMSWHLDWSMWYLAEVQYMGMTELHLAGLNAITCIIQLATIGLFAKMNRKISVNFTIIFAGIGLCLCPVAVLSSLLVPLTIRPYFFIVMALIGNFPFGCVGLCIVQMLLDVLPDKNRSLITSLYTIAITLSNSLLPLLGVRLYTMLGADQRGLVLFNFLVFAFRFLALVVLIRRWQKMKHNYKVSHT